MTTTPLHHWPTGAGEDVAIRRVERGESFPAHAELSWFLDYAGDHDPKTHQVWAVFDQDDQPTACALVLVQPGRTALIFTSQPLLQREIAVFSALIQVCCSSLTKDQAILAQALLWTGDDRQISAFIQAGFVDLATLSYLQLRLHRKFRASSPPAGVHFETWSEGTREQFIEVLEKSYVDTLDCPDLTGLRMMDDVVAGHMGTGEFEPEMWTLMRLEGEAAGLLLMNPVKQAKCVELVYIGLDPKWRGRGLGRCLLEHGLEGCVKGGHRTVTLAVDEINEPALDLYRKLGFSRVDRKRALIKRIGET